MVAGIYEKNPGPKDDLRDAFQRAEELRTNRVPRPVFKAPRRFARLRELGRVHSMLVQDVVRVQSRLKAMYRGRGVPTLGKADSRGRWTAPASGGALVPGSLPRKGAMRGPSGDQVG